MRKNCLSLSFYYGTTIVAIRTPTEVIVGADSKVVAIGGEITDAPDGCKIIQVGNFFFAHAKILRDTLGKFSVHDTVVQSHQLGNSISATVRTFEDLIVPSLVRMLQDLRSINLSYFTQNILKGGSAVDVIFFGIENAKPVLFMRYFVPIIANDGSISVEVKRMDCPGDCPGGMTFAFMGAKKELNQFLDQNPHYSQIGWVPTINKLISLEAEANPDHVAPPIDIMQVDNQGARWLQRKPECPDIVGYLS